MFIVHAVLTSQMLRFLALRCVGCGFPRSLDLRLSFLTQHTTKFFPINIPFCVLACSPPTIGDRGTTIDIGSSFKQASAKSRVLTQTQQSCVKDVPPGLEDLGEHRIEVSRYGELEESVLMAYHFGCKRDKFANTFSEHSYQLLGYCLKPNNNYIVVHLDHLSKDGFKYK